MRTLLAHDLVDELRLTVSPVMIGSGLRIFPEQWGKTMFELANLASYDSGVVLQAYRRVP